MISGSDFPDPALHTTIILEERIRELLLTILEPSMSADARFTSTYNWPVTNDPQTCKVRFLWTRKESLPETRGPPRRNRIRTLSALRCRSEVLPGRTRRLARGSSSWPVLFFNVVRKGSRRFLSGRIRACHEKLPLSRSAAVESGHMQYKVLVPCRIQQRIREEEDSGCGWRSVDGGNK